LKHIKERNDAQYELTKKTTKENREKLHGRRKSLKREKIKVKKSKAKRRGDDKTSLQEDARMKISQ
jgi:hypothetical protein